MSKGKIIQSAKLYLQKQGEKEMRHITNWPTFLKVCEDLKLSTKYQDRVFLDDEDFPPKGKPITEWPEKEPEVEIRKMAILGTCLPGCEEMMKNLGGVHYVKMRAYGNRTGWPKHKEVERLGMKMFINIRDDLSIDGIRDMVLAYKDRPVCGGYWCDKLGHEPDITNPSMDLRKQFYNIVRACDPDAQNHPVMEMMNNTSAKDFPDGQYPGWENAFSDETHDLLLFDCYPGMDEGSIKNMENTWNKFIKVFPKKHQVIPQMQAFGYKKGGIWRQYNFWKEKMASGKFDNPYRGQIGVCWYNDASVRKDSDLQQEIKEVIADAMA